jgi:hypothetical protein
VGVIDRTLKILCRHHPDWPRRLLFPATTEVSLEIVRLEINLPERRFDDAYRVSVANGEEKFLFVEFLFGQDRRELFKYFTKVGIASAVCGYGKVAVAVVQITEGMKTPLDPVYGAEVGGVVNQFRMHLIHLNALLPQIESGELYEYGCLLPLLKKGADQQTLMKMKDLIHREPDSKKRADLYSLAVTVCARYLDKDLLWEYFREELEMIKESEIVEEWIQEGIEKGMQQGALLSLRELLIQTLETRFDLVPQTVVRTIGALDDVSLLKMLHRKALTVASLDQFAEVMEAILK